jgi:uracil-DNA glycosylase
MKIRDPLQQFLRGWQEDVPAPWRPALEDIELDFRSRCFDRQALPGEIVIPRRENVFRAFGGILPQGVRAVILGQDPYPNPAWATGRAFEQGDLGEWPEDRNAVADSLARIVQTLAFARTKNKSYVTSDRAWKTTIRDLREGRLHLQAPTELFDHLRRQGVLFLNTSLTLGLSLPAIGPKQSHSHFTLWRPFIQRILTYIATRPAGYCVFLLWGNHASDVFERGDIQSAAERAGAWQTRIDVARHFHPAAITRRGPAFLCPPNPFVSANKLLRGMGAEPIDW